MISQQWCLLSFGQKLQTICSRWLTRYIRIGPWVAVHGSTPGRLYDYGREKGKSCTGGKLHHSTKDLTYRRGKRCYFPVTKRVGSFLHINAWKGVWEITKRRSFDKICVKYRKTPHKKTQKCPQELCTRNKLGFLSFLISSGKKKSLLSKQASKPSPERGRQLGTQLEVKERTKRLFLSISEYNSRL